MEMKLSAKEEEEVRQRREIAKIPKEEQKAFLDRLRVLSRYKYLPIREDKIKLSLEEEIFDNDRLFGGEILTITEIKQQEERKKKFWRLLKVLRGIGTILMMRIKFLKMSMTTKGELTLKKSGS